MSFKSDPDEWKDPRHRCGAEGEGIAAGFLETNGWRILERRFRLGRCEVDLIVQRDQLVAFVEVKTRRNAAFGSPLQAIGWKKRREIQRVAAAWMDRYGPPDVDYRFDVVGVELRGAAGAGGAGGAVSVEHLENAFQADWR